MISTLGIASNSELIKINHLQDFKKEQKVNSEKKPYDTSYPKIEISKDEESPEETKCFRFRKGEVEKEHKGIDLISLMNKENWERTEHGSWKCRFCPNTFYKWKGLMAHARKVHKELFYHTPETQIKREQNLTFNSPKNENERKIDIKSIKQNENWEKTAFGAWKCKFCKNIFSNGRV